MAIQAPGAVVLVRPRAFSPNPQTASDNTFQAETARPSTAAAAYREVTEVARRLTDAGVTVHLFDDDRPTCPDSVFPNNWLSTHQGGRVALYPMYAPNRRIERRGDIVEFLKFHYRVQEIVDYSGLEQDGLFLEGTGAMVLDHESRIAYVARSRRADPLVLERFCTTFGYEPMVFDALDAAGVPVYHTNVLMCIASTFALIGADMINDETRRAEVTDRLRANGRSVLSLSEEQVREFAGNALELSPGTGELLLCLSTRALAALTITQRVTIERTHRILPLDIPTVELGGGSVRCMLAGVHLDPRVCSRN